MRGTDWEKSWREMRPEGACGYNVEEGEGLGVCGDWTRE